VSINPFTGTNQNTKSFWKRAEAAFDERWLLDPYFKALTVDRNVSAMIMWTRNLISLCFKVLNLEQTFRECSWAPVPPYLGVKRRHPI
jgi:hypothetical protein